MVREICAASLLNEYEYESNRPPKPKFKILVENGPSAVWRRHCGKIVSVALLTLGGAGLSVYFGLHNHAFSGLSEYTTIGTGVFSYAADCVIIPAMATTQYRRTIPIQAVTAHSADRVARKYFERLFTDHSSDRKLDSAYSPEVHLRVYEEKPVVLKIFAHRERVVACDSPEYALVKKGPIDGVVLPTHYIVKRSETAYLVEVSEVKEGDVLLGSLAPFIAGSEEVFERFTRRREEVDPDVALSMAKALQNLHRAGFAHRDLKPENLLIDAHNKVYIIDLDFVCDSARNQSQIVGTDGYIAPELLRRSPRPSYNPAKADIYSLGRILGENMLGLPFREEWTPEGVKRVERSHHDDIQPLIAEMIDSNPETRPAIAEVVRRLDQIAREWHESQD